MEMVVQIIIMNILLVIILSRSDDFPNESGGNSYAWISEYAIVTL